MEALAHFESVVDEREGVGRGEGARDYDRVARVPQPSEAILDHGASWWLAFGQHEVRDVVSTAPRHDPSPPERVLPRPVAPRALGHGG